MMDTTPVSLLERVKQWDDADAWRRLTGLITPLLFAWAHRAGLRDHDAADLVQDVLAVLVEKLPEFDYDRETLQLGASCQTEKPDVHSPSG